MDLQKRSDALAKAKKALNDKSSVEKLHKAGKNSAYEIMDMLFDEGTFVETNAFVKAYANELATSDVNDYEGVVTGYGAVDGRLTFAYAQNAARSNGAFSKAAANKICALYEMALKNGAPVISVFDSNGAKIEEGIDVLAGYGLVMKKIASLKGKVPQISVVCAQTSGACATISQMTDICVMTKDATISQSPVNVLCELSDNKSIATSEYAAKKGMANVVCEDAKAAFESVKEVLSYLPSNRLDKNVYTGIQDDPNRQTPEISDILNSDKYDVKDVVKAIADGGVFFEMNKDASKCAFCGFATVNGIVCGVVATNKSANEGKLCSGGIRKITWFIDLCNTFGISIVNLVDTDGLDAQCEADGGKMALELAKLSQSFCKCEVPVVTVNTGVAYGTLFTVLGSKALGADVVFALDFAKIGVLDPKASVSMMWADKLLGSKAALEKRKSLEEDWALYMSTPLMAAYAGHVDDIINANELRMRIASALEMLSMKSEFANL